MPANIIKKQFENLYSKYNRPEYIHPDPLETLFFYENIKDREIVGLIASSLAYGRVAQILKSITVILEVMGPSPYVFLGNSTYKSIYKTFKNFRHRFADGKDISALLTDIRDVINTFGSLNSCFVKGFSPNDKSILPAMHFFVDVLLKGKNSPGHLVALPENGSACKRMNLFLRWMIRKDAVDPGGWQGVSPSLLLLPLDTHMHRISRKLGFTSRKQADMKTVIEVTDNFRTLVPDDPVKYDFALSRIGIVENCDGSDRPECRDCELLGFCNRRENEQKGLKKVGSVDV